MRNIEIEYSFQTILTFPNQSELKSTRKLSSNEWLKFANVRRYGWKDMGETDQSEHEINHDNDVILSAMTSQITSLTIVYSTVYSRRRSKKTSKLRATGPCEGNSPVTGEFPAQRASNAENVSSWWRHHDNARMLIASTSDFIGRQE